MTQRDAFKFKALDLNSGFQYWLLAGITLLALILRFYKLGEWSFWIDEIYTINRAQIHYSTFDKVIQNIPPARNWVPLSVIATAAVLNMTEVTEWSARLVPAFIGLISIPILYFPVKRFFSPSVALVAALLLAVSPWHLFWSQNARFYTSLLLFYNLALFAFFLGLERDRLVYLGLFILLTYIAISERLFAVFIIPVVIGYLLFIRFLPFERPPGFRLRNFILLGLPLALGGAAELYSFVTSGTSRLFGGLGWFFLYRSDDPLRMLLWVSFSIGIPLMSLAFFGGLYSLLHKNRAGLLIFLGALVPVVILLGLNPFVFTQERYVFFSLVSWIILAAVAITELASQTRAYGKLLVVGVLVLLLADAAGDHLLYYQVNHGNRRDWKGAFTLIKANSVEGDTVVSYWPELGSHYLGQEVLFWEEVTPETVSQSRQRTWFVVDSETVWANPTLHYWLEENGELVDVKYLRTPDDFWLRIYLYDPKRNTLSKSVKEADYVLFYSDSDYRPPHVRAGGQ